VKEYRKNMERFLSIDHTASLAEKIDQILASEVDGNLWTELPADFNWLALGFVAKARALSFEDIGHQERLHAANVALRAWGCFVEAGEPLSAVMVPELLLRAGLISRFGDLSEELCESRLSEIIHALMESFDSEDLRSLVGKPVTEVDRGILLKLRWIRNYLGAAKPYLRNSVAERSDTVRWWFERLSLLP